LLDVCEENFEKLYERVIILLVRRGDIFYADLSPVIGSEQGGIRPVLIVQNDVGNRYSPTVICAAITSQINKAKLPTHIEIDSQLYTLVKDSVVLLEQVRTIDKKRLREKICRLDEELMKKVDKALLISFGLDAYI
jgi:mRNA interferase MazF